MKTTRLGTILAITMLTAVGSAHAQGTRGRDFDPDQMLDKRLSNLTTTLDLTDGQVASLRPILSAQMEAMMAMRDQMRSSEQDREALRSGMQALHASTAQQVQGVLTESQFQAWEENVKKHRKKHGRHGGRGQGRGNNRD